MFTAGDDKKISDDVRLEAGEQLPQSWLLALRSVDAGCVANA